MGAGGAKRGESGPPPSGAAGVTAVRATVFAGGTRSAAAIEQPLQPTMALGELIAPADALEEIPAGQRYVAMGELGRGGMGRVGIAFDRLLGRTIARKEILEDDLGPLLVAEAQVGAQLEHPAIVPVYDVDTDDNGNPRYTMRVVRGRSLTDVLAAHDRPPLAQLLGVFRQVCLAVDYAHSRGVVHRDLKPDNVIVGEFGEVYVLDWGIAWLLPTSDLSRPPDRPEVLIAGTPAYMAPEQTAGEITPAVDVYALGAILYEILSDRPAFASSSDIIAVASRRTVPPPSRAAPDRAIPPVFDELVTRCLARRPGDRPVSARALAEAVDGFLDGERALAERSRDADALVEEGRGAWDEHVRQLAEARELEQRSEALLSTLAPHEPVDAKLPAWDLAEQARRRRAAAARTLARCEIAYGSALARVGDHAAARRGLAALHLAQFLEAEAVGDALRMATHSDLARAYDDGTLEVELDDAGELVVVVDDPSAEVVVARYESAGMRLVPGEPRSLGATPTPSVRLPSGSYLVTVRAEGGVEVRYPLRVLRARRQRVDLRVDAARVVPQGMVLVPGGPFLTADRRARLGPATLPDFAIARFPVTMGEFARFLESLPDDEAASRVPRDADGLHLVRDGRRWKLAPITIRPEGRMHVPVERELDLPVLGVTWYDALAYATWRARVTGVPYRLPTALEWEKAMRGGDDRPFPMGYRIDPAFAKMRLSRAEGIQPELVGAFPLDESPYGVRDLAGGVADLTSTAADGSPLPGLAGEGTADADTRQALYMGGYWGVVTGMPMRIPIALRHRSSGVGFRLAMSLDPERSSDMTTEPIR